MKKSIDEYKIAELIHLELRGELSEAESLQLEKWRTENSQNEGLYKKIVDEVNIAERINAYNNAGTEKAWTKLVGELDNKRQFKITPYRKLYKYVAAASIILLVGGYLLFNHLPGGTETEIASPTIILSGTQKAILTTSNNDVIELGESKKGREFKLTDASVKDTNNTLTYQNVKQKKVEDIQQVAVNTLETPRGGEYSLVLSDGTRVYLNAESKLIFPEVFGDGTREVTLEGEAYFEVSKSGTRAFIVKTLNYDVKVYGTSFNVSAYSSDLNSHTTLVEGRVGVNAASGKEVVLVPGEQAYFDGTNKSIQTKKVDTRIFTAWKDGIFMFENESLEDIMIKLERWYDTETEYASEELRDKHFTGTLNRYGDISGILEMIALTTHIQFTIEGNTIKVNKKNIN